MHGETFFGALLGAAWDDVVPLARILEVTLAPAASSVTRAHCQALWKELSYLGSNDLAYLLRGFEGVDYPEIVRDVCKHLRIRELRPGDDADAAEHNEQLVLQKIFEGAWERLDAEERRELLGELNLDASHLSLSGDAVAAAIFAGQAGGFAVFKLSAVVANWVARALLGQGLPLGARAELAHVLAIALGPVGWVSSGAWLGALTTPAKRKLVPAVVLIASLRQAKRAALAETAYADPEQAALLAAPVAARKKRKTVAKKRSATRAAAGKKKKTKKTAARPAQKQTPPAKKRGRKVGKKTAQRTARKRKSSAG